VATFPIKRSLPANAVPPGRTSYDISADRLLLHTIQTSEAFDSLLSTGVLKPDTSLSEPLYAHAYDWMARQMARMLDSTGDGALWFWARINRRDLVDCCRRADGEVLLTCNLPRERVLLSHFGDWHSVLNSRPHVPDLRGESDEEYGARRDLVLDDFDDRIGSAGSRDPSIQHWPEDLRTDTERGWEHILEPANYGRFEVWQATTHWLSTEDVIEAVRLER
jgi:hypothetical protein